MGRDHFDLVAAQLDVQARGFEEYHGVSVLEKWEVDCRKWRFMLFGRAWLRDRQMVHFSSHEPALSWVRQCLREAENVVREERGLPRVGECWVAETRLYYQLKDRFEEEEVLQHASPSWLGRQHIDIYFPERSVGIEYHGVQHNEPVAFFGGLGGFKRTQERDRQKARKCADASVTLLVVRPGYLIDDVVDSIVAATR